MRTIFTTLACLWLVACGADDVHPLGAHGSCDMEYNDEWQGSNLVLVHDDDRDCPTDIGYQEMAATGGIVVDTETDYPYHDEPDNAVAADLEVWDQYPNGLLAQEFEFFHWGMWVHDPFANEAGYEWQANFNVVYVRGVNPDLARFIVDWNDIHLLEAIAVVTITYDGGGIM
jgi:hypothetical protein